MTVLGSSESGIEKVTDSGRIRQEDAEQAQSGA